MTKFSRRFLAVPYGFYMALFIVLPIFLTIFYAFSARSGSYGELTMDITLENFRNVLNPTNLKVIWLSVRVGIMTTLICFALGYPLAYILSHPKFNFSSTLVLLFVLPMWINFLLRTVATKALFNFLDVELGMGTVLFGMVYNFLPFMILPIYTTLINIDKSLIEAATDLGASPVKAFLKVTLPLSFPGIISGVTMVFTPVITTFVISDLLSYNMISLIGNVINNDVNLMQFNNASALSFLLLLFIAGTMIIINKYDKNGAKGGAGLW
jgi:spermidine/putrescine transport system permease protein